MKRLAQIELELAALLHLRIHLRLEEMVGTASIGLGAVKRHIGVAQELIGFAAVGRRHRNADTGANDQLMSLYLEGLGELGDDLAGKLAGASRRSVPLHDCKFVPAQARHHVAQGHHPLQAFGYHA